MRNTLFRTRLKKRKVWIPRCDHLGSACAEQAGYATSIEIVQHHEHGLRAIVAHDLGNRWFDSLLVMRHVHGDTLGDSRQHTGHRSEAREV